jgi:16S rRNA C1402 (ribose-2'-O) methylase RsmI
VEEVLAHFKANEPRGEFVIVLGGKEIVKTTNNKEI